MLEALEGKRTFKETTSALAGCRKLFWYARTSMVRTCGINPVCLVYLVCLVSLMQPNKPDRPDRPNEQDRLADFLSIQLR